MRAPDQALGDGPRFVRAEDAMPAPLLDGMVEAFAALADLRDGYGADHSRTLVRWACAIGGHLGLEGSELDDVAVAARLHDIGKVGVPDRILHKPGALDEAEWGAMRRHAVLGADVLGRLEPLQHVALIVRHHHERWDGGGYPDGLAGESIPIGARIVAVCEALGALVTDRPYRRAYDHATAMSVLEAASGRQFDPAVVAAMGAAGVSGEDLPAPAAGAQLAAPAGGAPRTRLVEAFDRMEALPASVEARDRLTALLAVAGPPAPLDELSAIVESDVALTVGVLRLANAERSGRDAIASVPAALEAIGAPALEGLLGRLAGVGAFQRIPGWEMTLEQFRLHAVATQRAAEQVARALERSRVDTLLVAALLHDTGKLVLASAHAGYPSAVHGGALTPEDRLIAERRELGVDHAVAGGVMARRWRLPSAVVTAIEHHHDPDAQGDVAIVRLADMLAHHGHGRGVSPGELAGVGARLGLGAADLRTLLHDLPRGTDRRRATTPSPLSQQETAVLRGLAAGRRYKEIGSELGIAVSTIRSHASTAYAKLGVADRAQAVLKATANGWL